MPVALMEMECRDWARSAWACNYCWTMASGVASWAPADGPGSDRRTHANVFSSAFGACVNVRAYADDHCFRGDSDAEPKVVPLRSHRDGFGADVSRLGTDRRGR